MQKQDIYRSKVQEVLFDLAKGLAVSTLVGYLFYKSLIACVVLAPLGVLLSVNMDNDRRKKKKELLETQFVDFLMSFAGALKAGYSAGRALPEAADQMDILYGGEAMICKELNRLRSHLELNRQAQEVFFEFAERTALDDALMFAEVFEILQRSGGDMISVVSSTANMISEKLRTRQDIRTSVRAKEFEQKLMDLMPIGILLYMKLVSPGFMDSVYGNITGVVIMTAALVLYAAAFVLGKKTLQIEV